MCATSVPYNVSSILGVALTPFAAVWLAKNHGVGPVGIYLTTLSVVTFIAIWLSKETSLASLDTPENDRVSVDIETIAVAID
jgi:hypothetical protein